MHPANVMVFGVFYAVVLLAGFIIYQSSSLSFAQAAGRAEAFVFIGIAVLGTWLAIAYS